MPRPTYTIDDVPPKLARTAIDVQDACNPSGLIHALARAVTELHDHPNYSGTAWIRYHPIVLMFVEKLHDLAGRPGFAEYEKAYVLCRDAVETVPASARE